MRSTLTRLVPRGLRRRGALWAAAIREGFVALLPLTLLGALALMLAEAAARLAALSLGPEVASEIAMLGQRMYAATMGIMALAGAASIAGRACDLLSAEDPAHAPPTLTVSLLAAAVFIFHVASHAELSLRELGYGQVFKGIVLGLLTAELSHLVARRLLRSADQVGLEGRSLLRRSLRMGWVAALALGLVGGGGALLERWLSGALPLPWSSLVAALQWLDPGPVPLSVAMTVLNQLAWLVGINGGQMLIDLSGLSAYPLTGVQVIWSDDLAAPMFMNAFGHLGGAGATWGLIAAILWRSRDVALRRLAQAALGPALINVNEVLLFGLPLVFSRTMLLPFVLVPAFNVWVASSLAAMGWLPHAGTPVVWSTPIGVSGVAMTHSWWGGALQLVLVAVDAMLYLPFLSRMEAQRSQRLATEFRRALSMLMGPPRQTDRWMDRHDGVGDVARGLMEDFTADLRGGRVRLAYQPQHDPRGTIIGVEALMRWHHPRFGEIPTAAIINVAEECDVIHELGAWVVRQACCDMAALKATGHHGFTMSVNMSPLQLELPEWPQQIAQAIRSHGLQPQDLDIEITEGRMLSTTEQSDRTLDELAALGVHLSMDDFGMGCTSLLYMQRFRVHSIKLDGALTRDVLTNTVNQDIIQSVVRLGHAQGVQVIAEFVQTPEQRDRLAELGCDSYQGWLYSPALPLSDLMRYMEIHRVGAGAVPAQSVHGTATDTDCHPHG